MYRVKFETFLFDQILENRVFSFIKLVWRKTFKF